MKKYSKVIFCGIGSSAMPGEIIKSLNLEIPVLVSRENFPRSADKNSLCFIISYSGNTKETINLFEKAKRKKCKIVIISSGGKLSKSKYEIKKLSKDLIPRDSLIECVNIITKYLGIIFKEKDIDKKLVEKIAKKVKGKFPVIYSSSENLKSISLRWRTQFNENNEILSHSNFFPEVCHNEIEANFPQNSQIIILKDKEKKQIEYFKKLIKKPILEIDLKGENLIDKIIYGIKLGDEVTKKIAEMEKKEYKETPKIDKMHKLMDKDGL